MASSPERNKINQDEVVRALVPDPMHMPVSKMLVGLVGASPKDDFVRLYFSTELKDFLEIRKSDVLLSRSLVTPENPLGGTALWVLGEASVEVTRRAPEGAEEEFLTGQITARYLRASAASGPSSASKGAGGGGLKSVPPVESCIPALCMPPIPPADPPGNTAVCTLSTRCSGEFVSL